MPGYKPETWNPIIGCTEKSEGCKNCFAKRMAHRLMHMPHTSYYQFVLADNGEDDPEKFKNIPEWNGQTHLVKSKLTEPMKWKSPRMVFTVDMGDLFHESVPFEWIDAVFTVMSDLDQHIYILLTKRPERILELFCWKILRSGYNWRPKYNIWFGVTAENQEQANIRIPILLNIPAAKRFVSIEPMLGSVDLTKLQLDFAGGHYKDALGGRRYGKTTIETFKCLDWVICGGESGSKARPMHPDWVRSVRDQCESAKVPFFFKQWGEWMPITRPLTSSEINVLPKHYASTSRFLQITDPYAEYYKAGKHKSGDKLDGKQHHEWPKINL